MKILFIGDYSNLHATLAVQLRRMGHQADVLSDRCGYMNTHSDLYVKRNPGFKGAVKYLFDLFSLLPRLKDYDAVQLINSNFFHLRPGKIKYFFDRIKGENKSVFLTLAGNDYFFVKACVESDLFRFSEFKTGNKFTEFHIKNPAHTFGWISDQNRRWSEYLYQKIDGAMSVLPEYDMAARDILGEKLCFTNLPIDLTSLPTPKFSLENPVKIFIGMRSGMEIQKGTAILKNMAIGLANDMPGKVAVESVKDLPLNDYLARMNDSHIVLDQLYSYSPAMNALYAMALGKVVATGAQPEYYDCLDNNLYKPILSLSPFDNDIKERISQLVSNPETILIKGREGRELVKANNDSLIVAKKFLNHWKNNQ